MARLFEYSEAYRELVTENSSLDTCIGTDRDACIQAIGEINQAMDSVSAAPDDHGQSNMGECPITGTVSPGGGGQRRPRNWVFTQFVPFCPRGAVAAPPP